MIYYYNKLTGLILLICIFAVSAAEAQKKKVQVKFKIVEKSYLEKFGNPATAFDQACTATLIDILQAELPFIEFTADNSDIKIMINVNRDKSDLPLIDEFDVDINMKAIFADRSSSKVMDTPFRTANQQVINDLPKSPITFAEKVGKLFYEWVTNEKAAVIKEIIGNVSLTNKIHVDPNNERWILPFSKDEFGVNDKSKFKISSNYIFDNTPETKNLEIVTVGSTPDENCNYPTEFCGKIKACFQNIDTEKREIMRNTSLKILGTYLVEFVPLRSTISDSGEDWSF